MEIPYKRDGDQVLTQMKINQSIFGTDWDQLDEEELSELLDKYDPALD